MKRRQQGGRCLGESRETSDGRCLRTSGEAVSEPKETSDLRRFVKRAMNAVNTVTDTAQKLTQQSTKTEAETPRRVDRIGPWHTRAGNCAARSIPTAGKIALK